MAALMAPAEVPTRIGKGFLTGLPRMSRTALTTPTWYAARAPPPVSTRPARNFGRNSVTLLSLASMLIEARGEAPFRTATARRPAVHSRRRRHPPLFLLPFLSPISLAVIDQLDSIIQLRN